ncbi:ATP-binding protein [Candidatus Desantisbacteria bacterium]|nr:ATP-binding protein [Candidatus Desantisbacteria bacterium]
MLYARDILLDIEKVILRDEFIILTGARQTGKTSLLIMLKNFLEEKGGNCYYLNLENPDYLKLLNSHPFNIFELIPEKKIKQTIFVDEIQYLDNPTNFLKLLYDEKRNKIKIIASGSSAFYIDKKFHDSLAGRKFLFEVYPLNFNEYLIFNQQYELLKQKNKKLSFHYKEKILELWNKYIIYGGYPKVVLSEDVDIKKIILDEIGLSYVKKDIMDAGIKNTDKYFSLLKILANQTGQLVNLQELSVTMGIAHKTLEEYLYVMKESYQISFIRPFYKNLRKELTKMPKVYFYDLGLRNFLLNNYNLPDDRSDKGSYLENIVFIECVLQKISPDKIKFWRTLDKKEIDFIIENEAFEIKFNRDSIKRNKYEQFEKLYPEIKLNFYSYDDILEKFYLWRF